jgi:tRNA(adenine34) deaminase
MKINFLLEALKLAQEAAAVDEVPVGAVVVRDDVIVGSGRNFREHEQSVLGHAELMAIEQASKAIGTWRLNDCDLYVTLEPCPMCLAACQQARVRKVVYGAKDEKGGAICLGYHLHSDSRLNHRFDVVFQPQEECSRILKEFFTRKRGKGVIPT